MALTVYTAPRTLSFHLSLYNQTLAPAVSAGFLRHVRCDVSSQDNMTTVELSADFERFYPKETTHAKAENRIQRVGKIRRRWDLSAYLILGGTMDIKDLISTEKVQSICQELGIRDWTKLTETKVQLEEAGIIQAAVGSEALQIPVEKFQQGLDVELEHGLKFPDANVTNNHPLLTGKIVLAHLKEMLDYYTRLKVAELEGDMFKASKRGDAENLARIYKELIIARAALSEWEKSMVGM
jgi:hypothetical protein